MPESHKNKNRIFTIALLLIVSVFIVTIARDAIKNQKNTDKDYQEDVFIDNSQYIQSEELRKRMLDKKDNLFVVDIRDRQSFLIKHISETTNIPIESLYEEYEKIPDKKNTLVLIGYDYSQTVELSELSDFLASKGFSSVLVLSGGILEWEELFFPTISMGNPNSFVDQSKINYLDPVQLKIAIENNYSLIILDVRPSHKFKANHIPRAINIPSNELEKRKGELKKTKEIVVYGESELEDFQAAVRLYDMGFLATYVLDGGLSKWLENNFEMTK